MVEIKVNELNESFQGEVDRWVLRTERHGAQ